MEAEEQAEMMKKNQEKAESKMGSKSEEKPKQKTNIKDGKAGKSRRSICTQWAVWSSRRSS